MDQEKKAFRQSICVSVIIMAFSVAAFLFSLPMPGQAPIFPRMAAAFLFLCGLGLLIGSIRRRNKGEPADVPAVDFSKLQSPFITLALMVVYALGFRYVGFYVTTAVITLALMLFMGIRSIRTLVLVEVVLLAFLYFLFTIELKVPMPLTPLM